MANVYQELIRLLPSTDTVVGKILSVSTNTAVISMIGGGTSRVHITKGSTYAQNDWVLVKDNTIVSTIPVPQGDDQQEVAKVIEIY
jgi:hypothetical protein